VADPASPPLGTPLVAGCVNNPQAGDPLRRTYENVGTVFVPGDSDSDPSHYCNPPPGVDIEKSTNGFNADDANGGDVPVLNPGDSVTWTYEVSNTGVVSIPFADVTVAAVLPVAPDRTAQ
jgi:hypothetical protein